MKKVNFQMQDIMILFEIIFLFQIILSATIFATYVLSGSVIDVIKISTITNGINIVIAMIGTAEGARGITKTAISEVGTVSDVPFYKISYIIKILVINIVITLLYILAELYCRFYTDFDIRPEFDIKGMIECVITSFVSYTVCRYGTKVTENIDLSSIPFFKKK
jgi:hypothetical protein